MKTITKKGISVILIAGLFLCAAIILTGAKAYADDSEPAMMYGSSVLGKGVNGDNAQILCYGRIYDEDKEDWEDDSFKWFVIGYDNSGNSISGREDNITLLHTNTIGMTKFDISASRPDSGSNEYNKSTLKLMIEPKLFNSFEANEKGAITKRKLDPILDQISGETVSDAVLWPLSAAEAQELDPSILNPATSSEDRFTWWLRSPGNASYKADCVIAGIISDDGQSVSNYMGIRPAFDLNMDSILFTSASTVNAGGKYCETGGTENALTEVTNTTTNEWKVTLKDKNNDFSLSGSTYDGSSDTVTVSYTNAITTADRYISAIITDKDITEPGAKIKYYGWFKKIKGSTDQDGSVTIKLGDKFQNGDRLYVFNEECNADNITDYASELKEVLIHDGNENKPLVRYPLWVGGTRVASGNANDVFGDGKVSFKPESDSGPATLTLKDYECDFSDTNKDLHAAIEYTGTEPLTIELEGSNVVKAGDETGAMGIYCNSSLAIKGTGTLSVTGAAGSPAMAATGVITFTDYPGNDKNESEDGVFWTGLTNGQNSEKQYVIFRDHVHDFVYGPGTDSNAITATCQDKYCLFHSVPITLSLNKPKDLTYDGKAKEAALTGYPDAPVGNLANKPQIVYYKAAQPDSTEIDGDALGAAPANAGNYVAQITWGGITVSVAFTIVKADQTAPAAPEKASLSTNTVTLKAAEGCEYSKDGETWQDSPEFTGLSADTEYTFYQRLKADTNHNASGSSEGTKIRTSEEPTAPTEPTNPPVPTDPTDQFGDDGTPVGPGASEDAADEAITKIRDEKDPKGSRYGILKVKSTKQTKRTIKLTWKKNKKAAKYLVYGAACGKTRMKKLTAVTTSYYTVKKLDGKKLKKGKYYKFIVVALDENSKVVSTSKTAHAVTAGGKYGNHKAVTTKAPKNKVTLKTGKSFKLKAKAIPKSKKKKVRIHRGTCYESSDPAIATVSSKGTIKAKTPGTCKIYAYAQNGVGKTIRVTVK